MRKKYSLKSMLFAIIMLLVMSVILIINIFSLANDKSETDRNYNQNGKLLLSIAKNMIDTEISRYENILKTLSEGGNYSDFTDLRKEMKLLDNNDFNILNIYYTNESDGSDVQSLDEELPEGYDSKSRPWYKQSVENKDDYIIQSPYLDSATGKNVITISKAVVENNTVIGVLGLDIELTQLSNQLSSIKYGTTGQVIISAEDGFIISATNKEKIGGQEVTKYSIWNDVIKNNDGKTKFSYNGKKYRGYYSTSEKTGWKLMLNTEVGELNDSLYKRLRLTVTIMVAIIIAAIIIVKTVTKGIDRSLNKLSDMMQKASEGDFTEDIDLNSKVKEFTILEESCNKMKNNLSYLIGNVNESVNNVDDTVVNSMRMSSEISSAIDQVGATMGEIAGGTNQCSIDLEGIVVNMQHLSDSINIINDKTNNVNRVASETNDLGSKGIDIAELVLEKSNQTKNSTEQVSRVVEEVSKSIEKIQGINDTISDITEQTNLLALNAAIEAARAGEAGKGFAVVSGEIGKLAEETAASAAEISKIISDINIITKTAVDKVVEASNYVNEQEKAVIDSQSVFSEIVSSVKGLSNEVESITTSITEIGSMKDNVLQKVDGLSALLEETAAGSEEVSASAQEIDDSANKFVKDFDLLKDKSDQLKENISQFKF
ncbi:MAG: methyl-accepting chemotaxis protein [Inconstantimicrobium porci]|uniref:methyl-accepting chemotaxis protein n=1 Tax=Inconstantimicrobium porci TaxID=2652291 RepID=UPI002A90FD3E|nr:methyl-accepting chemotaxis protein [Inconstantimicrobium porci]MDY5911862.1 methyl-accepting chemotaxis protein [Inconstantimicrobium porci]